MSYLFLVIYEVILIHPQISDTTPLKTKRCHKESFSISEIQDGPHGQLRYWCLVAPFCESSSKGVVIFLSMNIRYHLPEDKGVPQGVILY